MARRQVSIFINGREVANQIKSITTEKRKIVRELNQMKIGSDEYNKKVKELTKLNGVIDKHRNNLRGVESTWSKVSTGVGKFAAVAGIAFGAEMIVEYGKKLFSLGSEMELLTRKAKTVFGEALPQVTEAARANANAMGLTVSQYTDASAAIGDLLIPMKFTREEAAAISTGLVDLSGALSEWTGGQRTAEEVTEILGKAMLGEREQLKSLGISIQEADVKARLAQKGLTGLTGEMLQQAKAAATLELITEKSADAQAAFAENSDTSARKQAELTARLTDVTEKIATALVPVFARLLEIAVPVVETIGDIIDTFISGEKPVGKFAKQTQFFADTLGFLKNQLTTVFNLFATVVNFLSGDWEAAWLRAQLTAGGLANTLIGVFNTIGGAFGAGKIELFDLSGTQSQIDLLNETTEEVKETVIAKRNELDTDAAQRQAAQVEKAKAAAKKKYTEIQKEIEKGEAKLVDLIKGFEEEARLAKLTEGERKLEDIRLQYQKQIDLAKELEAKGSADATAQIVALEKLKGEAIQAEKDRQNQEFFEKDMERLAAEQDAKTELELADLERKRELDQEIQELLRTDQEQEMLDLELYYFNLIGLAESYGIDTTAITAKLEADKTALVKKNSAERTKTLTEEQQTQIATSQAYAKAFGGIANAISGAIDLVGDKTTEAAQLSKVLALANIGIQTAQAIATGVATATAAGPFPANLAAIATTVGTVLSNVAAAKKLLNANPIPQRRDGGYHAVKGAQDGMNYRARYIGAQSTGMLPDSPSIVLASERGREYFVSNNDLQNPVVANYVRMIDNISNNRGGLQQFVDGGFSDGAESSVAAPSAGGSESTEQLINVIGQLTSILNNGIMARIDDDTVVDINEKFGELNAASGGVLG